MHHLDRVSLFLRVAQQGSFTGAARTLGLTASAVSKQVQALEQELGVRLLQRTTRRVSLTEAGEIYSERARRALEDLSEAERQIQELRTQPKGIIRFNAPMAYGMAFLVEPLAVFARRYPEVRLEVDFDDRQVDLVGEGYDLVLRIGVLEDSSLVARRLGRCPILLCASPDYVAERGVPECPEDLAAHRGVVYSRRELASEWRFRRPDGSLGSISLPVHCLANNAALLREAVLAGVGVGLLPIFEAESLLRSGRLVHLLPTYRTAPEREISLLYPRNRFLVSKVRLLIDWLVESSRSLPWVDQSGT